MFSRILAIWFIILSMSCCAFSQTMEVIDMVGGSEELVDFLKVDEGESISFKVKTDSINLFSSISVQNMPEGSTFLKISKGVYEFSWIPSDTQNGIYTVGFYSRGSTFLMYKSVRIIVANTKFMLTSEEDFSHLFTATDPDNDSVELIMTGLPSGSTFVRLSKNDKYSPKLFSWTPTKEQLGVHDLILTATDVPLDGGIAKQDVSKIRIVVTMLPQESIPYDFNKDGKINLIDYAEFSKHWLKGVPHIKRPPPVGPVGPVSPNHTDSLIPTLTEEEKINNSVAYRTRTGKTYHKVDCRYLKTGSVMMKIKECKDKNMKACSRCKPD